MRMAKIAASDRYKIWSSSLQLFIENSSPSFLFWCSSDQQGCGWRSWAISPNLAWWWWRHWSLGLPTACVLMSHNAYLLPFAGLSSCGVKLWSHLSQRRQAKINNIRPPMWWPFRLAKLMACHSISWKIMTRKKQIVLGVDKDVDEGLSDDDGDDMVDDEDYDADWFEALNVDVGSSHRVLCSVNDGASDGDQEVPVRRQRFSKPSGTRQLKHLAFICVCFDFKSFFKKKSCPWRTIICHQLQMKASYPIEDHSGYVCNGCGRGMMVVCYNQAKQHHFWGCSKFGDTLCQHQLKYSQVPHKLREEQTLMYKQSVGTPKRKKRSWKEDRFNITPCIKLTGIFAIDYWDNSWHEITTLCRSRREGQRRTAKATRIQKQKRSSSPLSPPQIHRRMTIKMLKSRNWTEFYESTLTLLERSNKTYIQGWEREDMIKGWIFRTKIFVSALIFDLSIFKIFHILDLTPQTQWCVTRNLKIIGTFCVTTKSQAITVADL